MSASTGPDPEDLARVAHEALKLVTDGMLLGLGTGRAAEAFIDALGARVRGGLRVRGVPTSERSFALGQKVGIELTTLEEAGKLDLAFDGADEVTPELALTKGLGGALLRERVVAFEAERFIVLVTPEKLVPHLGTRTAIPLEIVPFAAHTAARHVATLGGETSLRKKSDGFVYATDNGNWILDATFGPIREPRSLDAAIRRIPGIVDTGIFLDLADLVLVGESREVRRLRA